MEKINVQNKVYIFLNHQKLINNALEEQGVQKYKLRPEIFNFFPKKSSEEINQQLDDVPKKKRRKNGSGSVDVDGDDIELMLAANIVQSRKDLLPQNNKIDNIERYWEESKPDDFPKFKGANHTDSFQIIKNLVKQINFLIPPKTNFYNYEITELKNHLRDFPSPFDLIVIDPPWRNKYIRRLKRHNLGYNMLENKYFKEIPIANMMHKETIVAIWCTNSKQHQEALLNDFLPSWNLRILHSLKWLKLNVLGEPINLPNTAQQKRPYEMLYLACHKEASLDFGINIKEVDMILSIPSIIHSHKPPLLEWIESYISFNKTPKCLELFARYLQTNFTSFGLEVLKLMDTRLYEEI